MRILKTIALLLLLLLTMACGSSEQVTAAPEVHTSQDVAAAAAVEMANPSGTQPVATETPETPASTPAAEAAPE